MTYSGKLYACGTAHGNAVNAVGNGADGGGLCQTAQNSGETGRVQNCVGDYFSHGIKHLTNRAPYLRGFLRSVKVSRSLKLCGLVFQAFVYIEVAQQLICGGAQFSGTRSESIAKRLKRRRNNASRFVGKTQHFFASARALCGITVGVHAPAAVGAKSALSPYIPYFRISFKRIVLICRKLAKTGGGAGGHILTLPSACRNGAGAQQKLYRGKGGGGVSARNINGNSEVLQGFVAYSRNHGKIGGYHGNVRVGCPRRRKLFYSCGAQNSLVVAVCAAENTDILRRLL